MKTLIGKCLFAALAFVSLSAEECGETHYISDSGFDLWCGDSLCDWEVLSGSVAPSSTWHKDDYSVELVGDDVVISQLSTRSSTRCLRFEVLADIDDDARLTLQMDFDDDGHLDYEQELGHVRWERLVHLVATPNTWSSVRFTLQKQGPGRARLAQLEATADTACVSDPTPQPVGKACAADSECLGEICASAPSYGTALSVCSGCRVDEDCQPDQVCGVSPTLASHQYAYRQCVAAASRDLGLTCVSDGECGTGVCCDGRCSECCDGAECTGGDACDIGPVTAEENPAYLPSLCAGGDSGTLCFRASDCDSGACEGAGETRACDSDGRDCQFDTDCPFALFSTVEPRCVTIGIAAGICQ